MKKYGILVTLITAIFMSTGCEIDFFTTLQNDIRTYNESIAGIQRSTAYLNLQTAIQTSQSKHDGATEGTSVGNYTSGSRAPLQSEINSATTVLNNPVSTDTDYDTARTTLTAANTTFDTRLVKNLDVFIFVDVTASMVSKLNSVKLALNNIIVNISSRNTDARYSVIVSHNALVPLTGGFVNSAGAQVAINGLTADVGSEIWLKTAIQVATENYSWTSGSDRIAIFITDSPYRIDPTDGIAQNMLTSNNIISVACVDSEWPTASAEALFNGAPLNAYNAVPGLPAATIESIITSVLQSTIPYW